MEVLTLGRDLNVALSEAKNFETTEYEWTG